MRVRYSFSARRTGHIKNIRKQRQKYPDIVNKLLEYSSIILEVLDARFIKDTRNLELEKHIINQGKKIIYVINKSDLTSKERTEDLPFPNAIISCKERTGIAALREKIKITAAKINSEKVVVGVIGYPNTGKSSLINLLIGKSSASTGAEAGHTKGIQKLKLTSKILLIDSPGVIPKEEYSSIEGRKIAKHTKVGARTYSKVKDPESIVAELMKEFSQNIESYYKIDANKDPEILLEKLGRKKNILKRGGEVNFDKTSRLILRDWQAGKIKID
jgi:ribosome biogenesis GTPase A